VAEDYLAVSAMHATARLSPKGPGLPDPQLHLHFLLISALDASGKLRHRPHRRWRSEGGGY